PAGFPPFPPLRERHCVVDGGDRWFAVKHGSRLDPPCGGASLGFGRVGLDKLAAVLVTPLHAPAVAVLVNARHPLCLRNSLVGPCVQFGYRGYHLASRTVVERPYNRCKH